MTPFLDLIEELRALGGAPKVTFPYGDAAYPQTERVIKAKRGAHVLAFLSAEPDAARYPACRLTEQMELRADAQYVEVYRKYEVIPGPLVASRRVNEKGVLETTQSQRVAAGTTPDPDGTLVVSSQVQDADAVVGTKVLCATAAEPLLTSRRINELGVVETIASQRVAAGSTTPADGLLVTSDEAQAVSLTKEDHLRKTVASNPAIISKEINPRGDLQQKIVQTVAAGSTNPSDGLNIIEANVRGISLSKEEFTSVVAAGYTQLVTTQAMDEAFGEVGIETNDIVDPATSPAAQTTLVLDSKVIQKSATKAELTTRSVASQPSVFDLAIEDETRTPIVVTHQVIGPIDPASPPSAGTGQEIHVKALNKYRGIRSTFTIFGTPASRVEYVEVDYTYPSLLTAINGALLEASDGEARIGLYPTLRSGFQRRVIGTVTMSYHTSEPAPDALTPITPRDVYASGIFIQYSFGNVLCDSFSNTYTTGSSNPKWPSAVETISIPASTPSASAYLGLGTLTISSVVKRWKFGLWRKETTVIPAL